jgi:thiamine-phosphate pyrophosphorylase
MPKPLAECLLYTILDTAYLAGRDPVELARSLCGGGADLVQLRAKQSSASEVSRLAEEVQSICEAADVWFVVNDYPGLAKELGAPLCHLGQEDFFEAGWTRAVELFPASAVTRLGLSTHAPEQAHLALSAEPVYIAVGPVYATSTKPGRPAVTLEYVRWASRQIPIPWFAIGGINLENLDDVLSAGARRVCAVSAILAAPDPAGACAAFRERLSSAAR